MSLEATDFDCIGARAHSDWHRPVFPLHAAGACNVWFSNQTVFIGIAALLALQAMFIYAPFMHAIFASAPLTIDDDVKSILVGAIILPAISLETWWHGRHTRERTVEGIGPCA